MLKVGESIGKALTHEEERLLLAACEESRSKMLYGAVVLALHTDLRSNEIHLLRWAQVDLTSDVLRVGKSKTKAETGRSVPLNRQAAAVIRFNAAGFADRKLTDFIVPSERYGRINPSADSSTELESDEFEIHGRVSPESRAF